ncbi:MAG: beta-ketoacyl-[acyl-carrier-protein] synthase family protein [Candidatus Dadabacteria bacterium]|nr:MAG: beta-ketoacyl-[acyl-carrier-protein] synthase family protein [Candidatus Dadabacteria bacterium]
MSSPSSKSTSDEPEAPRHRRVVISGIGVFSPSGVSVGELEQQIFSGRSALRTETFRSSVDECICAVAAAPEVIPGLDSRQRRRLDRFCQMALYAACQASEEARLTASGFPATSGIFWGSGFGGIISLTEQLEILQQRGCRRVSPLVVPAVIANAAAAHIAETFEIRGPSLTFTTACAASGQAIGEAWTRVASGELDVAIAGGSEAALTTIAAAGFLNARALARQADDVRPFGEGRSGFALAEGACALILEPLEQALERRAPVYAEVLGYGTATDAWHITEPDPKGRGAERAIREALRSAGLHPRTIDYVNAHATGTVVGDRVEAEVIARVYGTGEEAPTVSSTKGLTGHLLGAAGAIEAAVTALALRTGLLPPNTPVDTPGDDCPVPRLARPGDRQHLHTATSHAFGFGGVNTCIVLGQPDLRIEHH